MECALRTCAQAMTPDFNTISGLDPKFSGFQRTRSASVPGVTEPTRWLIPWVIALFRPEQCQSAQDDPGVARRGNSRVYCVFGDVALHS